MKKFYEFKYHFINDRNNTQFIKYVYSLNRDYSLQTLFQWLIETNELHLINYATRLKVEIREF